MEKVHPLSRNQELIWHMQRLLPAGCPLYRDSILLRLLSDYDILALRRTCQWLADRHPALRTSYHMRAGKIVQIVREPVTVPLLVQDARGLADDEIRSAFEREAHRPFALETAPLMHASLFLREPGRHTLLLSFHHIATDLYSSILLLQDFRTLYPIARQAGTPPEIPKVDYLEFVRAQAELIQSGEGMRQWGYWKGIFERPASGISLPCDCAPESSIRFEGKVFRFSLGSGLSGELRGLAQNLGATLNAVLLAGFQALLHRWCGQERFLIRTMVTGRSEPCFASVVGCFAHPVPVPADFSGDPEFREVVGRASASVAAALDNQDLPLLDLAARLRAAGLPVSRLSSDAMFRMQIPHRFRSELRSQRMPDQFGDWFAAAGVRGDLGGLTVETSRNIPVTTSSAIDMELVEAGGEISGAIHYAARRFRPETIDEVAGCYAALLERAAKDPELRVSSFHGPASTQRGGMRKMRRASGPMGDLTLSSTEERVARLWSALFGIREIGGRDDFFALGGDSLMAVCLSEMIASEFGFEIPMGILLECPTLSELAAHIDSHM